MDVQAFIVDNTTGKPHDILMTFDTGAYMTSIDSFTLSQAGYSIETGKNTIIDTIGHKGIPAKEILLRDLKLEDISGIHVSLGPVFIYAVDMSDTFTVGVLGLNVIREFETKIKFGQQTIIELDPAFDINDLVKIDNFIREESRFGLWTPSQIINNNRI